MALARVSVRAEFDEPVRDSLRLVVSRAGEADQRLAQRLFVLGAEAVPVVGQEVDRGDVVAALG